MNTQNTFETWFNELKQVAIEKYGFTQDAAASMPLEYRDYFEGGYSPEEALSEDFSYL